MTDEETIEQIARMLRSYLAAHPKACDTVRGIAEWWLSGNYKAADTRDVQAALQILRAEGCAECIDLGNGTLVWRAPPDMY